MKVEDVMTTDVHTVRPDTPLKAVAQELVEHAISGLPVVGGDGEVLGVISEADLLVKEAGSPRRSRSRVARLLDADDGREASKREARVAGEAMSAPAITIAPFQSTAAAAAAMLRAGINRLPVVRGSTLIGIVTRADLVRAFARSDEQVAAEVRQQADYFLALVEDFSPIDVSGTDGEVTLAGAVKRRSSAEELPRYVSRIPGVVGVSSQLTWQEDDTKPKRERSGERSYLRV
jgi:CBS domain-containing protein